MPIIKYEKDNRIAIFTIDNPKVLGALSVQAFNELHDALVDFRDDDNLLVGILTGTGDKIFSAGVDIKDFLPFIKRSATRPWIVPGSLMRRLELWKPVIAACNGLTYGGGLEMSLACDFRIASENAKFAMPEAKLGVFPGGGGTQRLPITIPRGLALEMLFTGKSIDAQEAYRIGLVNRVVPLEQLMPTVRQIALDICENGPLAVRAIKECVYKSIGMNIDEGLKLEEYFARVTVESDDFNEGTSAFIEKRKPQFKAK